MEVRLCCLRVSLQYEPQVSRLKHLRADRAVAAMVVVVMTLRGRRRDLVTVATKVGRLDRQKKTAERLRQDWNRMPMLSRDE